MDFDGRNYLDVVVKGTLFHSVDHRRIQLEQALGENLLQ